MKVQPIQSIQSNTNFEAKQRFLTPAQRKNVNVLIEKMGNNRSYTTNGMFFELLITNRLKANNSEFVGARLAMEKDEPFFDKIHFTVDKAKLVIDSKSGEIENWQKPFFTRWSTIMKNIDNYLAFFVQNFDNPSFVKKEGLKLSGMTKEAFEVFSKELDKLFKNRKKNL